MPRISIPKTEQKSGGFSLARPGQYDLRIAKIHEGKGPKGAYLKFELEVIGATSDPDGNPLTGPVGRIFDTCTLLAEKRWRLSNLISAAGFDPSDCDTDELNGALVPAIVDVEKDGEWPARNVVKRYIDSKK